MTNPAAAGPQQAATAHDLPALRVHRAWRAAEDIADRAGVDRGVALEIAREVVGILGEGTRRWGVLCVECRGVLADQDGRVCPEHGRLSPMSPAVLLIAFDPVTDQTATGRQQEPPA